MAAYRRDRRNNYFCFVAIVNGLKCPELAPRLLKTQSIEDLRFWDPYSLSSGDLALKAFMESFIKVQQHLQSLKQKGSR